MKGIYRIENKINNRVYIGKSISIGKRWYQHLNLLENNSHPNKKLQNDFIKYGFNNFLFDIIELCDEENLCKKEDYYIKLFSTNSYNIIGNYTKTKNNNYLAKIDSKIVEKLKYIDNSTILKIIIESYIKYYNNNENYIEISSLELSRRYNISPNTFYRDFEKCYKNLINSGIYSSVELIGKYAYVLKFNDCFINTNSYIKLNKKEINNNFKTFRSLKLLLKIKSSDNNKICYKLDDFKNDFNINKNAYSKFGNIKSKVLNIIKNDIINLNIDYIKDGRQIKKILFEIPK